MATEKDQKMLLKNDGLAAELSMKQAMAIELQKEVKEKEEFIFTCNSRMEKGLPQ